MADIRPHLATRAALDEESGLRADGDDALTAAVLAEADSREAGDTALAARIDPLEADLGDPRPPTGGAGGVLDGNYPNPGFAVDMAEQGELNTVASALAQEITDRTADVDAEQARAVGIENSKLAKAANLSDVANTATALANLGGATPADVSAAIAAVIDSSPAALDTLNELAAALGDDANFASTVTNSLAQKAPKDSLPVYLATNHGMVCDGVTDDTAALNALLATVYAAGGGHIYFPRVARINGRIVLPNDGAAVPKQPPIRLSGAVADQPGQTQSGPWLYPSGGLDLRYAGRTDSGCGTVAGSPIVTDPSAVAGDLGHRVLHADIPDRALVLAVNPGVGYTLTRAATGTSSGQSFTVVGGKLASFGLGTLELDHLALVDEGTSPAPFGWSTNTTIKMHDCLIRGNAAKTGVTCDQDQWVFGGPGDGTVLTTPLSNGVAYTALAVAPLPFAISSGRSIVIGAGTNTQTVTTSGSAAVGATSIPVTSFTANADYPAWTPINTPSLGSTGSPLSPFQGYGSHIYSNHFERTRRILAGAYASDLYIENNQWWQTCGSNLAKAPSTLTAALVKSTVYTSLSVTALSQAVKAGDTIQIGVASADGAFFQAVTASADAAAGATTLAVNSFTANAAYATGTKVYDTSRGLGACIELYGSATDVAAAEIISNRFEMVGGYSYATLFGQTGNTSVIAYNNLQDAHANNIAGHRFHGSSGYNLLLPAIVAPAGIPLLDDAGATNGGIGQQTVFDLRPNKPSLLPGGVRSAGQIVSGFVTSPTSPRVQDDLGNQFFWRVIGTAAERIQLIRLPVGGAEEAGLELSRAHIVPLGTVPTIAVLGSAGAGALVTIAGTDTSGTVTLTSGSSSLAIGELFQVSYNKNFFFAPKVTWIPANAAAAALGVPYASTQGTASTRLGVTVAPAPSTVYMWNYLVIG